MIQSDEVETAGAGLLNAVFAAYIGAFAKYIGLSATFFPVFETRSTFLAMDFVVNVPKTAVNTMIGVVVARADMMPNRTIRDECSHLIGAGKKVIVQ